MIDVVGLRSIPNVAEATSRASGMMSPVVFTPARPPRLALKLSPKPPATEIVFADVIPLRLITNAVESPSTSKTGLTLAPPSVSP